MVQNIDDLRKMQVKIQNRIEKQESNGIYDEELYKELDRIDADIWYLKRQEEYAEEEDLKN